MPATLRPTRLEVSDRFPMLGFSLRNDGAAARAEVALAADPALFDGQNKGKRTLNNFYSSRAAGNLTLARGESMYVVPPEVLSRFVGQEKLYFGLASGADNAPLQVDVRPHRDSPYISLKGLSNRSMTRVRVLPSRQQRAAGYHGAGPGTLEWAGDLATPGMVAASVPAGNQANPGNPAYDDGFGPMPAAPAATPATPPASAVAAPPAAAQGLAEEELQLAAPPAARARAMDGGASAAIAIGGFIVESIRDSAGDVTWELDQFAHIKHPNDAAPTTPVAFKDAATIRLDKWPVAGGLIDDISAWFSIDWQYNGKSLGNIRIGNIGTNDAVGWGLHVRAQIMDDNILYQPNQCAALRLRFHYRFSRSIGSDVIAVTEVHLFGDGTYEQSSQWLQAAALALETGTARPSYQTQNAASRPVSVLPAPESRARARTVRSLEADPLALEVKYRMFIPAPLIDAPTAVFGGDGRDFSYDGGSSRGELTATVRLTPGGGIAGIDTLNRHWGESTEYNSADAHAVSGKPSWWLDKNPGAQAIQRDTLAASDDNLRIYVGAPGTTRAVQATVEQASLCTIEAAGSLPLSSVAPAIDADISLLIRINGGRIEVKVQGEHDGFPCHELYVNGQRIYSYDPVAAGSSPSALMPPMDVTASTGWISVATLAASQALAQTPAQEEAGATEELQLAAPPAARARAMDGGASAAIAIGGFIVESIRDSAGDVTWELDQFAHIKHPNDAAPTTPVAFRDASTIRLDKWPVAGGLIDDISAWFSIDWQYNGKSLGNIRIGNIGTNDAVGWGLHVRAQIMDDNILYQPNQCAALRLRFHYRFSRSIGSDVIAVTEVHLFGDGTYEQSSQWLQAAALSLQANLPHTTGSNGNVSWDLMQYPDLKTPSGQVAASARIQAEPIQLADWPYLEEANGSRTQLALELVWAYDAAGAVGALRITPGPASSAGGRSLAVSAGIEEIESHAAFACLQVTLRYVFTHASENEQVAVTRIKLYGNGKFARDSQWQASAIQIAA